MKSEIREYRYVLYELGEISYQGQKMIPLVTVQGEGISRHTLPEKVLFEIFDKMLKGVSVQLVQEVHYADGYHDLFAVTFRNRNDELRRLRELLVDAVSGEIKLKI